MFKLKTVLDDIIDRAYPQAAKNPAYKKYYVEYINQHLKSKNGDYAPQNAHIRVFTRGRSDAQILKTSLHELAHHMDYIRRGETGHQSSFYEEYRKLLYAAMDMKIFSAEEYRHEMQSSAHDYKKVCKMLDEYVPKEVSYKKGKKQIVVHNGYTIKEKLKENGYRYNAISKNWEKEYPEEEHDKEIAFISSLTNDFESAQASAITFQRNIPREH